MVTIEHLAKDFPQYIKTRVKGTKATDWSYETEIGLCKMIINQKLKLIVPNKQGEKVLVSFVWEGSEWNPFNRPTKRKHY